MGKMKVYELAKELGMSSKDLTDKLTSMKYDIKNHMSSLEDSDVEKIRKQFGKSKNDDADANKKNKKPAMSPVIIRREVTRVESNETISPIVERKKSDDLGVVQRRSDVSMNIKYRTPPRKIGSITPQKEEPKAEVKAEPVAQKTVEVPKKVEEIKKVEEVVTSKEVESKPMSQEKELNNVPAQPVQKSTQQFENRDGNGNNNNNNNFQRKDFNRNDGYKKEYDNKNRERVEDRRFNMNNDRRDNNFKDNRDGNRRPYNNDNRDGFKKPYNNDNKDGFRKPYNNENKDGFRKPFNNDNRDGNKKFDPTKKNNNYQKNGGNPGNKVEKEIQGIMSAEVEQKDTGRESIRTTAYKDKEKDNRKFEESTKKVTKAKGPKGGMDDINMGKLER